MADLRPRTDALRVFAPNPAATLRLVCFPHAGGAASAFRDLALALPPWIEVTAVQYPGRQDRYGEPLPGSITGLAAELGATIWAGDRRPAAFLGHSMGALVAFEVARHRQPRFPSPLAAFVASACPAPSIGCRTGLPLAAGAVDNDALGAYVRRLGGAGAALPDSPELRELVLPVLRHDLRINEEYEYRPGPPLTCPVLAVVGDRDPIVDLPGARAWRGHTGAGFDTAVLPGGHFYLEDHRPELVALLAARLKSSSGARVSA